MHDSIIQWINWFNQQYPAVGTLMILMAVDIVLGFGNALLAKKISSNVTYKGVWKKAAMLMALFVANIMEPMSGNIHPTPILASLFILYEVTSVVEGLARAGVPFPKGLLNALEKLREANPFVENPPIPPPPPPPSGTVHIDHASNVNLPVPPENGATSNVNLTVNHVHNDSSVHA